MRVSLKKKKNWVEKSDFLASLWWTGRVMDEGHVVLPGKGCGRGNDGAAGTCVWGSESDCALLGKAGGHREMLGIFLKSLLLPLPQPQRGRGRHREIISHVCTVPPLPSHQLSSSLSSHPFTPSFSLCAEWSYLVLYPPLQKLFHPCLHGFKNCLLHPPSVLVFHLCYFFRLTIFTKGKGRGIQ